MLRLTLSVFLALWCSGCLEQNRLAPTVDPTMLSGEEALSEVGPFLALGKKDANTAGAKKAAEYLLARCKALGLDAYIDEFQDPMHEGTGTFYNVVAEIPGQNDELIILGGHFDTKAGVEGFVGANDGGSSTGLLLELGRVLKAQPIRQTVRIYFFDGEECLHQYGERDGFHGSKYAARKLVENNEVPRVRAMINLDMVGDKDLTITLPKNTSREMASLALKASDKLGHRAKFSLYDHVIGDDHVWFLQLGIPSIDLIDFEFGSAKGLNDYWHTDKDTLDKLSAESLEVVGQVTLEMLNKLSSEE